MIYIDEIKLQLNDARISYEKIPKSQQSTTHWSDWYAQTMVTNGVEMDPTELATLLREADVSYRAEPEQYPWLDYVSKFIFLQLQR